MVAVFDFPLVVLPGVFWLAPALDHWLELALGLRGLAGLAIVAAVRVSFRHGCCFLLDEWWLLFPPYSKLCLNTEL